MSASSITTGFDPSLLALQRPATPHRFVPDGQSFTGAGSAAAKLAGAKKTATEFEAMFATQMLESIYAGIKPDSTFGGGNAETMFRTMLNQEYGKAIARSGSLGIASSIQAEIIRMQERAAS